MLAREDMACGVCPERTQLANHSWQQRWTGAAPGRRRKTKPPGAAGRFVQAYWLANSLGHEGVRQFARGLASVVNRDGINAWCSGSTTDSGRRDCESAGAPRACCRISGHDEGKTQWPIVGTAPRRMFRLASDFTIVHLEFDRRTGRHRLAINVANCESHGDRRRGYVHDTARAHAAGGG